MFLRLSDKTGLWASLLLFALASHPTAMWYLRRMSDRSDEPLGLAAMAVFAWFAWELRHEMRWRPAMLSLGAVILLGARFSSLTLPPLLVAAITLGLLLGAMNPRRGRAGLGVLLLLSLPVMASLDFYAGAPMRLAAAEIARGLLGGLGLGVTRAGTLLLDGGTVVGVDPPCSGVRMLWTSLLAAGVLAVKLRLPANRTAALLLGASAMAVLGNGVRAAVLFFPESGRVHWPEALHEGAGLAMHGMTLLGIFALGRALDSVPGKTRSGSAEATTWKKMAALGCAAVLAAGMVLRTEWTVTARETDAGNQDLSWPAAWEGVPLQRLPLTAREQRFVGTFPGKIARFQWGEAEMILRKVSRPTRLLHSSAGCLRASGFQVAAKPVWKDAEGTMWGCFEASFGGRNYRIRERIAGVSQPESHTDVSEWYWASWWGGRQGPWLAVTIIEPLINPHETAEKRGWGGQTGSSPVYIPVSGAYSTSQPPWKEGQPAPLTQPLPLCHVPDGIRRATLVLRKANPHPSYPSFSHFRHVRLDYSQNYRFQKPARRQEALAVGASNQCL